MPLHISHEEARSFLTAYHLRPTDVPGVLDRLGSVQYDPLKPLGRNPDLVFQARVPDYRVDEWETHAYDRRLMYDAWDKQACLVPMTDWPFRAFGRATYQPWHDRQILEALPDLAEATLREIDERGPLSSLEFGDREQITEGHSWLGHSRIKRVLRALWAHGRLLTHHRKAGRHYYDRPQRVIPAEIFNRPADDGEDEYHRWVILRRHRAAGILRPQAEAAIWSACGDTPTRARLTADLVASNLLTPVQVGEKRTLFHMPAESVSLLERRYVAPMTLLGPLDSLLWDRKAISQIFGFDYVWEVYKPVAQRKWGYYVLPVFHGNRFVARCDSRLEGTTWVISKWWWEEGVIVEDEIEASLQAMKSRFMTYLGATKIMVSRAVGPETARILRARF